VAVGAAKQGNQMSNAVKVDREEFLLQLRALQPALAKKGIVEQTDCFTFHRGMVRAYNGEITIAASVSFSFDGCVKAKPLLDILDKLPDKLIDITAKSDRLIIVCRNKEGVKKRIIKIPMEVANGFRFAKRDRPKKWRKVHPDLCKAIRMAELCASRDEKTQDMATHVHITRDRVEALDNATQACIWRFPDKDTGTKRDALYKADGIRAVIALEPTEVCETSSWIHFRNHHGVTFSCIRHDDDVKFVDLSDQWKVKGSFVKLSKGLGMAALRCGTFTKDNAEENYVQVHIPSPNNKREILVLGSSETGSCRDESVRIKYKGPPVIFSLNAELLDEIVKNYGRCELNDEKLIVKEGAFTYVCCLQAPREEKKKSRKKRKDVNGDA
jgi:hypothetical protein